MRRYGLYDGTRGLTTLVLAGAAGLLLWLAARVGQQTTGRFWAEMGIVAGAGLLLALPSIVGTWSNGLRLRLSPGTFLLGFLPVLVCVGWILMATQPGSGWHEGTVAGWSRDIGVFGIVKTVALWHGVLAFGFGLVLGLTLDTVPVEMVAPVTAHDGRAADEPTMAERRAAAAAQPQTVVVGPHGADGDRESVVQSSGTTK
jgi:hypothetical protein